MANITAQMVKELRESTGAGMMDCKKALQEAEGNMEKAVDILREKGLSKAAKKADRVAAEGLVTVEINADHTAAAIVEVNSETDFVAKHPEFTGMVDTILKAIINNDVKTNEDVLKEISRKLKNMLLSDVVNNRPLLGICISSPGKFDKLTHDFISAPRVKDCRTLNIQKYFEKGVVMGGVKG